MKIIYLETSVIGYLTARPSNNIENAARQLSSAKMWANTASFQFVISSVVLDECSKGDAQLVQRRMQWIAHLPMLSMTAQSIRLAEQLIQKKAVPATSADDAAHIAIAAVHEVDAIASWNFRHISGAWARRKIEIALAELGYVPPIISTPEELLEVNHG
jgi:predicted nucleic acid-binding protein